MDTGTDVSDRDQVGALVAQAVNTTGRLDILISNAGVYSRLPVSEGSTSTAPFYAGQAAAAAMTSGGRVGTPDDIAKVITFLATDDAGWINGQIIDVDGGLV